MLKRLISFTLLSMFFISCEPGVENQNNRQDQINKIVSFLKNQGFNTKNYILDNHEIIVEGDIRFNINDLIERSSQRHKQYLYQYKITQNVNNIKVKIDTNLPSAWQTATRNAMAEWNSIEGNRAHFTEVTSGHDMDVKYLQAAFQSVVADATFPSKNGIVGARIRVNPFYNGSLDVSTIQKKTYTMVHEFGHMLGLAHSNADGTSALADEDSVLIESPPKYTTIEGTRNNDPNTVMRAGTIEAWSDFSLFDREAVRKLYMDVNYENTYVNAPSSLTYSLNYPNATLNWIDNSNNELGFIVYKKINGKFLYLDHVSTTSYQITNLNYNTTYQYYVKANTLKHTSLESNIVSITPFPPVQYTISGPASLPYADVNYSTYTLNINGNYNSIKWYKKKDSQSSYSYLSYNDNNTTYQTYGNSESFTIKVIIDGTEKTKYVYVQPKGGGGELPKN